MRIDAGPFFDTNDSETDGVTLEGRTDMLFLKF